MLSFSFRIRTPLSSHLTHHIGEEIFKGIKQIPSCGCVASRSVVWVLLPFIFTPQWANTQKKYCGAGFIAFPNIKERRKGRGENEKKGRGERECCAAAFSFLFLASIKEEEEEEEAADDGDLLPVSLENKGCGRREDNFLEFFWQQYSFDVLFSLPKLLEAAILT